MNPVKHRPLLVPAVLAVALWIAGLVVINAFSDKIPHHPTDAQLLTWIQGNQNPIISGRLALDARLPRRSSGSRRSCGRGSPTPRAASTRYARSRSPAQLPRPCSAC